jgi:hypothetical protein
MIRQCNRMLKYIIVTTNHCNALTNLHTLQITIAQAESSHSAVYPLGIAR